MWPSQGWHCFELLSVDHHFSAVLKTTFGDKISYHFKICQSGKNILYNIIHLVSLSILNMYGKKKTPGWSDLQDAILDLFEAELGDVFTAWAREGWGQLLTYIGGALIWVKAPRPTYLIISHILTVTPSYDRDWAQWPWQFSGSKNWQATSTWHYCLRKINMFVRYTHCHKHCHVYFVNGVA